jgi:hypothetical protein
MSSCEGAIKQIFNKKVVTHVIKVNHTIWAWQLFQGLNFIFKGQTFITVKISLKNLQNCQQYHDQFILTFEHFMCLFIVFRIFLHNRPIFTLISLYCCDLLFWVFWRKSTWDLEVRYHALNLCTLWDRKHRSFTLHYKSCLLKQKGITINSSINIFSL